MTARKQIFARDRVRNKDTGALGTVLDFKFATKVPYHPRRVQVKWDTGLTTWVDVKKIALA